MKTKISLLAAVSVLALAGSALAADLPRRSGASSPVNPYAAPRTNSWSGAYVGLVAGYGWGSQKGAADAAFGSLDGYQLGGTLGFNQQWGQVVAGVEGDLSWNGASNSTATTSSKLGAMMTARGRLGYAMDASTLLFATGGYAGGNIKRSDAADSVSDWHSGYAAGAGLEYAFTREVSAKAEYLYTNLGNKSYSGSSTHDIRAGATQNSIRMGVNYRF
jgi:outer membrane immunogenic protein